MGNVTLVQGSLEINADRVVIHFNEANELILMEMTGTPATFRQLDDDQQEILGEALQIDYTQSESLLELRNSAACQSGRRYYRERPDSHQHREQQPSGRQCGIRSAGEDADPAQAKFKRL